MSDQIFDFLLYFGKLILLTLGTFVVCGFAVGLCSRLFSKLLGRGSGAVFDVTSVIGTPIHELGHAAMCLLFGHRIKRVLLWTPHPENGVYGFVEHTYNKKNPWAKLGNLFISLGPIFSGLGVIVLMLWLCFPAEWNTYLQASHLLSTGVAGISEITSGVFSLLLAIPKAFMRDFLRSLLGLLVILPVSLHVTLSWQDIKSGAKAMPMYLLMLAVFACATWFAGVGSGVASALWLVNLRVLSLFCVVIAFSAVWVLIALLIAFVRALIKCF